MNDLAIGLSGLRVAQRAIEVIGNNIANASTEGYHRQEARMAPMPDAAGVVHPVGRGVEIKNIDRMVDLLLDREIRRQQPEYGQVSQELNTLESVDNILGDLTSEGLGDALGKFFGALKELSGQPDSPAFREQAVWAADALAGQFRNTAAALENIKEQVRLEAANSADEVNELLEHIASYNEQIEHLHAAGKTDNGLLDLRDQALEDLGELVDVQVRSGEHDTVTVMIWGTASVVKSAYTELGTGFGLDGDSVGVGAAGSGYYDPSARGGTIGGMLSLYNDILPRIDGQLDDIAGAIIQNINRLHVQGTGTAGSFTSLVGLAVGDQTLDQWDTPITGGQIHVRVIDTDTGDITRETVTIDADVDDLASVAAKLDAIDHLTATDTGSKLTIESESGYTFDFMPALAGEPATSTLTGIASPAVSGVYSGDENEQYTFTVQADGDVGVTDGLTIAVTDSNGDLVRTLDVGKGYAAGDRLEVTQGVYVAFDPGDLNGGEAFTVDALAYSDTTGLLGATGVNALFSGSSAYDIDVVDRLIDNPGLFATTLGAGDIDNLNVERMAAFGDEKLDVCDGATVGDSFRQLASNVGQWVSVRRARRKGIENVLNHLGQQRDDISGVDINDEASKLLMFEQMFQGMAKYLTTLQQTRQYLVEMI